MMVPPRAFRPRARNLALAFVALFAGGWGVLTHVSEARAQCGDCLCEELELDDIESEILALGYLEFISIPEFEFDDVHEPVFMVDYFYVEHILAAMMDFSQTLTSTAMMQMQIMGEYFDAMQQLDTQRLFWQKVAEAHKDYQSSMDICQFGTFARSLGPAELGGQLSEIVLTRRMQDRGTHAASNIDSSGDVDDVESRLRTFKLRYCNVSDDGGALVDICAASAPANTQDKDISINRTIWAPQAIDLNIDYADGTLTNDEEDVLALGANLYGHKTFPPLSEKILESPTNQLRLLDERAIVAKRSVAENSYAALVALKTGDPNSGNANGFMQIYMGALGVPGIPDPAIAVGLPLSYFNEMDFLTKKIFEDPRFYTDLYDTPANVARKGAAIRALDLVQQWDTFKSQLRSEAALAEIVELDVDNQQRDVQDRMNRMRSEGVREHR